MQLVITMSIEEVIIDRINLEIALERMKLKKTEGCKNTAPEMLQ